jgi:hypothetical protein
MEVQSESQDKLAQISTDFERGNSLIVKGNFYQISTHKLHEIDLCVSVELIFNRYRKHIPNSETKIESGNAD